MFKKRVLIAEELNSKHRTIILRMGEHVPLECTEYDYCLFNTARRIKLDKICSVGR